MQIPGYSAEEQWSCSPTAQQQSHSDFTTTSNCVQQSSVTKGWLLYKLIAREGIYVHYSQASFLGSQSEPVKLIVYWGRLTASSTGGSAAGGKAHSKSALNHGVSECSLVDNTSRVQLFLAVIQGPAALFTVGALDFALWPRSNSAGCIPTKCPLLLLLDEHRSALLLNDSASQVNVVSLDTSEDNAQQHVCRKYQWLYCPQT